jgi:hypothetical protein
MSNKIKVVEVERHPAYDTIKAANKKVASELSYMKEVLKVNFTLDK